MNAKSIATVLPVPDLSAAVDFWKLALGIEPTFVDGERWAQFDLDGRRLGLAGSDRADDRAGVMIKVDDVADADQLAALGAGFGPVEEGPHELRRAGTAPGGWSVVVYQAKPRG